MVAIPMPNDERDAPSGTFVREPEPPIVVQKYGGSSVADVERLERVAERVVATRRAGHRVVVVVSAMGKTTDGLLSLASQAAGGDLRSGEPPRRELDMLVSTGERVSMSLLSIAIQARGCDAISFTGSQSGIITNDRHFDARIIEVRPHRIEDELARGRVVIVAGYQGMSYRREITTLGRGGSDTTAVALAAALEADRCEIYSDVDGIYTADPRVVPEAAHIEALDYATLQEMSEHGAKVVCAQAVEWARKAGVALYARSTFDAFTPRRQTIVRRDAPPKEPRARAVTAAGRLRWMRLTDPGRLPTLLAALEAGALAARRTSCANGVVEVVAAERDGSDAEAFFGAAEALGGALTVRGPLAEVSVVGADLGERLDLLQSFLEVVSPHDPVSVETGPLRLSALVDPSAVDALQRALHARFVAS